MFRTKLFSAFLLFALTNVKGQVVISEISDKGSSGVCGGNDWLELHNTGLEAIDLAGYTVHDDNGPASDNAFTFPAVNSTLLPDEYLLMCTQLDGSSPQFGIGGDDTISLVNTASETVASVGPLPDTDSAFDVTYARNATDGTYLYTTTPTPADTNVLTPIVVETPQQIKNRLTNQNRLGTRFFGMDDQGFPVADAFDQVLDLFVTMEQADYDYLMQNQSYEVYRPFTSVRLATKADEELMVLNSPGRIRPKGQSTLYFGACYGAPTIPFQLEFNTVNETQALFGVERLYLRNHFSDFSYMRDWASHRMLARFGLPHLRTRKVRFHINGERKGLYTLMEAPDQDYVFHRNFPELDTSSHSLFKVKTMAVGCGLYSDSELEEARERIDETSTPPYAFERGEHRDAIPVLGVQRAQDCALSFIGNLINVERKDAVLAYVRAGEECGSMLVQEGLVDRDLGGEEWEPMMEVFVSENLGPNKCDPGCTNSNLASQVDTENFLKNFAVYAVTLNGDSPMGNGNNYYLADAGDGKGWKIVQYDHNNIGSGFLCNMECDPHVIYWSITRPTCSYLESNQIVGPLLTDPVLHAEYIEYVRSFVDTVLTNTSFVQEMMEHAQAIQDDVAEDSWSAGGVFFENELSPNASEWNTTISSAVGPYHPFLPLLKARAAEVREQLKAIDEGTFPRGPHLDQNVEPWETCVDWRTTEAPSTPCYQNCQYEGCAIPGWIIPGVCDPATTSCIHGNFDEQCQGIADGSRYDGMENREDGRATFCVNVFGFSTKTSMCPAPPVSSDDSPTAPAATSTAYQSIPTLFSVLSLAICFVFTL